MNQEILSLRTDAAELRSILLNGKVLRHGESWTALPREVVRGSRGVESVVFEVVRPNGLVRPPIFQVLLKAIRPETLSMTLLPMLSAVFYGIRQGWNINPGVGICSMIGVLFFQISVNVLNDVEDHLRLVDSPNSLTGTGVLQKGWASAKRLKMLGYLTLVLGILFGVPAVLESPQVLLWIGSIGVFGVVAYSGRPFSMKYRALGDISILLLMGPLLTIGFSQAVFSFFDSGALFLGSFFGLCACAAFHANHIQSMESDRLLGIRTLAIRLGFQASRHLLTALLGLALFSVVLGVILGLLPASLFPATFLGLGLVVPFLRTVYRASGPVSALLGSLRTQVLKVQFGLGVLVALGLGLGMFL